MSNVPRHLVQFSGGISSWAAARRVVEADAPAERPVLLFADTLIEDEDTYRFLVEAAADVLGVPLADVADLATDALALPPWEAGDDGARKAALGALREAATARLPGLVWVADGRTPWEVFEAERFIGNARVDPCSKILKRQLLDAWRAAHCDPERTDVVVGLHWDEPERIARLQARGAPWRYRAPLAEPPWLTQRMCFDWARRRGLEPPRLYAMTFPHGNCGGACVKGGQSAWALVYRHFPDRFRAHEAREAALMAELESEWGILNDRRGGERRPLTLTQLRERLDAEGCEPTLDLFDFGGCGCAIDA